MTNIQIDEHYEFDEANHRHIIDGTWVPGVTTITGELAKPALVPWACKTMYDWIIKNAEKVLGPDQALDYYQITNQQLATAKTAWKDTRDGAADIGTEVHDAIEYWIKHNEEPDLKSDKSYNMFNKFREWEDENDVTCLVSEQHCYSMEHQYGGIVDSILEIDGKKYLGDIKTSKTIYDSHFYQMAGYEIALREMGVIEDIDGYIVINIPKSGRTLRTKVLTKTEPARTVFLSALAIYKNKKLTYEE